MSECFVFSIYRKLDSLSLGLILGIQMNDTTEQGRGWWEVVVAAVITLTVVSLACRAGGKLSRRKRLPPGPRRWPVVGSLLSMDAGALPHQCFQKLSKQYGPLMFLRLGSMPTVVVTNAEMAEAVLKTKDHVLASRPDNTIAMQKIFYNGSSFGFSPLGPYWRNMRKVCLQELFSVNRVKEFQVVRQREVLEMLHSILEMSQQQGIVTVNDFLSNLMTNILTQMMLGKSYCSTKSDSKSSEPPFPFLATVREASNMLGLFNIDDFIPILKRLDLQGYNKQFEALHVKWDTFLQTVLEEHRQQSVTAREEKSNKNFQETLLAYTVSNDPKCEVGEPLPEDSIKATLTTLLMAGTDTSSATVEWALAELLKKPAFLRRAQEELDIVVGKHRLVDEADIPELKYIQAVVKETFRIHPSAPLLLPHASTEDCEIAGYHSPAKSRILVNVYDIHRDPLVWERPLEFDPDRFLSTTRTIDVKGNHFDLLPFGSGRRSCVGMSLGLLMVQYPLAQLLHTVDLAIPEELDMSEGFGLICAKAIPLRVLAKPRLSTGVIYPTYIS